MQSVDVKQTMREELFSSVLEALQEQIATNVSSLRDEIKNVLDEYDLEQVIHDVVYDETTRKYVHHVVVLPPEACLRFVDEVDPELGVNALKEIHDAETRLAYRLIRKLFKVNATKLTLIEFYDVTLLYASFHADRYTKAHLLSQEYFNGLDEWAGRYFQATKEDVQYAILKLQPSIDYADEILLEKIASALSQENYQRTFVFAAKALCVTKRLFAMRGRYEIKFERRIAL